jgi:hypothetical protein
MLENQPNPKASPEAFLNQPVHSGLENDQNFTQYQPGMQSNRKMTP